MLARYFFRTSIMKHDDDTSNTLKMEPKIWLRKPISRCMSKELTSVSHKISMSSCSLQLYSRVSRYVNNLSVTVNENMNQRDAFYTQDNIIQL